MKTVAQQMSAAERRLRLLKGLNATKSERVVVNFSKLAHAIGMDAAESLIVNMAEMRSLQRTPYKRDPELVAEAMVEIDRQSAVDAIERVTVKTEKLRIDSLLKK